MTLTDVFPKNMEQKDQYNEGRSRYHHDRALSLEGADREEGAEIRE